MLWICRVCNKEFEPREWQLKSYEKRCLSCKRKYQNEFNANDPLFLEKHKRSYESRKNWYQQYYQKRNP